MSETKTLMHVLIKRENIWYLDDSQINLNVGVECGVCLKNCELATQLGLDDVYFYVHKIDKISSIDFFLIVIIESLNDISDIPLNRLELVALSNYFDVIVDSYKSDKNQIVDQVIRKLKPVIDVNLHQSGSIIKPLLSLVSDLQDIRNLKIKKEVFNLKDELDNVAQILSDCKISYNVDNDIEYIYSDPVKILNLLKILIEEMDNVANKSEINVHIVQHESDRDILNFVISADCADESNLSSVSNINKCVSIGMKIANNIINNLGGELVVQHSTGSTSDSTGSLCMFFSIHATRENIPDNIARGSLKFLRNKKIGFICDKIECKNEFFRICDKWGMIGVVSNNVTLFNSCDVVIGFKRVDLKNKFVLLDAEVPEIEPEIIRELSKIFYNVKQYQMSILIVCPNLNESIKLETAFKNAGCSNLTVSAKVSHVNLYKLVVFDLDYIVPVKVISKTLLLASKPVKGYPDVIMKPLKPEVLSLYLSQII